MTDSIEKKCLANGVKLTDQRRTIARVISESKKTYGEAECYGFVFVFVYHEYNSTTTLRGLQPFSQDFFHKKFSQILDIGNTYGYHG